MLVGIRKSSLQRQITVYSGVKGLVSHGNELREILKASKPEVLLVSISPAEIKGLAQFLEAPFEMNLSDYEIIYGVRLSKYGEVMTPPPIYVEAEKYSIDFHVPEIGIDIDQQEYADLYTKHVKTLHLIRHSLRKKRILNHDFGDTNEYDFAEKWIGRINRIKGLSSVDKARVLHMKDAICTFARENYVSNNLMVIDYEFYHPLMEALGLEGWEIIQSP